MPFLRQILVLTLLYTTFASLVTAEIPQQRLIYLRGVISLANSDPSALHDLEQAAQMYTDDWQVQMIYGQALVKAGRQAYAKGIICRATLLAPWRPESWLALARLCRETHDTSGEYHALAGAMRLFPDNPAAQLRMSALGRALGLPDEVANMENAWKTNLPAFSLHAVYFIEGRIATLSELRKLAVDDTKNAALLAALASAEWRAQNSLATYATLYNLYKLAPDNVTYVTSYCYISFFLNHVIEAISALQSLPQRDEALDRILLHWYLAEERYRDALPLLTSILQKHPDDVSLNYMLLSLQLTLGENETALTLAARLWAQQHSAVLGQQYASTLISLHKFTEAETLLTSLLAEYADETILQVLLANIYSETSRPGQAAILTERLATIRPETATLQLLAGERYLASGQKGHALHMAIEMQHHPDDLTAALGAVYLFNEVEDGWNANITLTRYLGPNVAPPMPRAEVYGEIAHAALQANHLNDALVALHELLKDDPNYKPAYQQIGLILTQQQQWNEAITIYRDACVRWPHDRFFKLFLARASRDSGDLLQAIAHYQALSKQVDDADPWLEMGDVYRLLGDEETARDCWLRAETYASGELSASVRLLTSYQQSAQLDKVNSLLRQLQHLLPLGRDQYQNDCQRALNKYHITASSDELEALFQLVPQFIDAAQCVSLAETAAIKRTTDAPRQSSDQTATNK